MNAKPVQENNKQQAQLNKRRKPMGFIHLHNHTDYSLKESIATIPKYIEKARNCGMSSLAITDHGNMSGAIRFYEECRRTGINPIIGTEFNIAAKDRHNNNNYHLILLAMNDEGYHNLMKLNSIAYTEGFHNEPRIDKETLSMFSSDLICLSACIEGEIPQLLLSDSYEKAKDSALWYKNLFGDRYYLEMQDHGLKEEKKVNQLLVQLSRELDIPLVCTNDIHYIEKRDWNAHDTLLCIKTKSKKSDKNRRKYKKGQYCFRTPEEMEKLFAWCPEAVENTGKIAERCKLEIKFPGPIFPEYTIPPTFKDNAEYLTYLANEGLKKRYAVISEEIQQRLDYELGIIIQRGYMDYFLVVWDYVHWAKTHDILVGPGRGSSAGSLVAYSLAITDVDPIKYDLLFERFINSECISLLQLDIDVDFCPDDLPEIINYITDLYGKQNVGRIIHYKKMEPSTIIQDVANVLDIPKNEIRKICSYISYYPNLKCAFAENPKFKSIKAKGGVYKELFDTARRLEGLIGHSFLHPTGVVIGRKPLDSYVPLYADPKTGAISTQYDMFEIGYCGLVKMDFVVLNSLTLIKHIVELIHKKEPDFDISNIDEHDKKSFDMLAKGDSEGVFQFESYGMADILKKAKPSTIGELIALNALYRPGPMQFIDQYIDSKNGVIPIEYPDPSLEEVLKNTYGVIIYQEQVMRIAQIIGGYTLGQADILRRDMGKRKMSELAEHLERFKAGAVKNGFTENHAEEIFHMLESFAGYGFNKSHAVAYSMIAYQIAFLKANFPDEFYAAMNEVGKIDC